MLLSERARGRWREILPILGVSAKFLVNRHGPCPICGGKDRFRFDDKEGNGTYICGQCGAGNGFTLVRKLRQWDFPTAATEIERIVGSERAAPYQAPPADRNHARVAISRLLSDSRDRRIVGAYLAQRGLTVNSGVLAGHPKCAFVSEGKPVAYYPAMVAPILSPSGEIASAQRIYVTEAVPRKERKKMMPVVGSWKGGGIRLHEVQDEMGVAEGIETALAAHELFGLPVWSALNDGGVEAFEPPASILKLVIFADNDLSFAGQSAAFNLGKRMRRDRPEMETIVQVPLEPESDWLDFLNARNGR